jgi:hypothetical protein
MGNKEGKRPQDLVDLYIDHYIEEGEEQTCYDIEFRFTKYVRVKQPE